MSILGSVHNRGGNGTGGVYSLAGDGTESVERWGGQSDQSANCRCVPFKYVDYGGQKSKT